MKRLQYIIDSKGKKVSVILPIKQYEKLLEKLDDMEDLRLYDDSKKDDDGTRITLEDYINERNQRKK
jgi:hypothetical protein